jgi:hypothetical protein
MIGDGRFFTEAQPQEAVDDGASILTGQRNL